MSKLLSARRATEYFLQLLGAVALAGYFSGIHLELRIFSAAVLAIVWYGLFFFVQRFGSPKSKSVAVGVLSVPRHVAAARVGRTGVLNVRYGESKDVPFVRRPRSN